MGLAPEGRWPLLRLRVVHALFHHRVPKTARVHRGILDLYHIYFRLFVHV